MRIEKEAIRHGEEWRKAFRAYMIELINNGDKFNQVNGTIAAGLADMEFGIYEEPKQEVPATTRPAGKKKVVNKTSGYKPDEYYVDPMWEVPVPE